MESKGIAAPSLTSVLDGGEQFHTPEALTLGKLPPLPTGREAGWIPKFV
jgi:hypothetical protein